MHGISLHFPTNLVMLESQDLNSSIVLVLYETE
jgi:hypothetical protein